MYQVRTLSPSSRALALRFTSAEDRFASTLELIDGEVCVPCLQSVEGTSDERWPQSPVFQELLAHDRPDGLLAGVGMAGKSHWSVAVTAEHQSILVDVACRVRDRPVWLGSTYHCLEGGDWESEDDRSAQAAWGDLTLRCTAVEAPADCCIEVSAGRLSVRPSQSTDLPGTIRWKFAFSWE